MCVCVCVWVWCVQNNRSLIADKMLYRTLVANILFVYFMVRTNENVKKKKENKNMYCHFSRVHFLAHTRLEIPWVHMERWVERYFYTLWRVCTLPIEEKCERACTRERKRKNTWTQQRDTHSTHSHGTAWRGVAWRGVAWRSAARRGNQRNEMMPANEKEKCVE